MRASHETTDSWLTETLAVTTLEAARASTVPF